MPERPVDSALHGTADDTNDHSVEKCCWVTLVTRPSYLPGVIILSYSLDRHRSQYPLVVLYTSSLEQDAIRALEEEARRHGRIRPWRVDLLLPRAGQENTSIVAERFRDTFTKLRAFEVYRLGFQRAVFLDADTAIFRNPDELMHRPLPGRDWLGANHACVCNLDRDPWAPWYWKKGNCAYTPLTDPGDVASPASEHSRPTYRLLNGGMLLFHPSEEQWRGMLDFFNSSDRLGAYQLPDQEFLADFFRGRWLPLSWKYNALKTMRYWHPRLWSDRELVVLHYIVDKPWERPVSATGIAGHLGRDGVTHRWWWDMYREWRRERGSASGEGNVVEVMETLMNAEAPYSEYTPLPRPVGQPSDVLPWP